MYSDIELSSTFLFMEDFHTFLFLPHFSLRKKSRFFSSFHISNFGRFPRVSFSSTFLFLEDFQTFLFLPQFSLCKISTLFFSSTFQFVEDFNTFLFLPHFSLWKIYTLSFYFHSSVCGRFSQCFPPFAF